jgi:phosphate transport system protein
MRNEFEKHLQGITDKISKMGSIALESIYSSVHGVTEENEHLSRQSRMAEKEVDLLNKQIKEDVVTIIARQQPIAADLRLLLDSTEISNEIERIADYANNIAKSYQKVLSQSDLSAVRPLFPKVELLLKQAADMFAKALASYEHKTDEMHDIQSMDDSVDALHKEIYRDILALSIRQIYTMEQQEVFFKIYVITRYIERIADRATNIGEHVHHMVTGYRKKD